MKCIFGNRIAIVALFEIWCSLASAEEFPAELVEFTAYRHNPVFTADEPATWDAKIRERGWILREGETFRMWYTGYAGQKTDRKLLGSALSSDGLHWTRQPNNPLDREQWIEDMIVVKHGDTYYMFAEGQDDVAQQLTSPDGLRWTRVGPLDIRLRNGQPLSAGPRGTPTVWVENGVWHLYYERRDEGVWLATSPDRKVWTNVQDEPVLARGPEAYDRFAVAMNQIVKHDGRYYAYYHGSDSEATGRLWSTSVAVSSDLIHWKKYPKNPILTDNKSSGILVHDGRQYRLYTMHDRVEAHFASENNRESKKQ